MASLVTSGRSLAKRSLAAEISLGMEEDELASQKDVLGSFRREVVGSRPSLCLDLKKQLVSVGLQPHTRPAPGASLLVGW